MEEEQHPRSYHPALPSFIQGNTNHTLGTIVTQLPNIALILTDYLSALTMHQKCT